MAFVVDWNRARRPTLVALRLGLPSDRVLLSAHLEQLDEPGMWRILSETGHAVSNVIGPPRSLERTRLVQALIHSWESSAELFLMSTIERLRSKCRLLLACDPALLIGIQQAVGRWYMSKGPVLLALDCTEPVFVKVRALFTDLDGAFQVKRLSDTRCVVVLSEQIAMDAWQKYLSAAFDQPLDDDMVTEDDTKISTSPPATTPTSAALAASSGWNAWAAVSPKSASLFDKPALTYSATTTSPINMMSSAKSPFQFDTFNQSQ
ncbi:K Homology domain-containing protein [Plasmodiophora brassicae]